MAKKKKTRPGSRVDLQFRNLMRGTRQPLLVLSDARNAVPISQYKEIISWIHSNPFLRSKVFASAYPQSIEELSLGMLLARISTRREFRWAGAYLENHTTQLAEFVSWGNTYSRALLLSQYTRCEEVLAEIQFATGHSLWLLKNRISLLQLKGGLEAQKQYANQIKQEAEPYGLAAFIAHYVSLRNEATVSAGRFETIFDTHIGHLDLGEPFQTYLQQHINPKLYVSEVDIADILRCEASTTVVDYYEMLLKMAQMALCSNHKELFSEISPALHVLSSVNDPRLELLLFELDGSKPSQRTRDETAVGCFDAFLQGDYSGSRDLAISSLANTPEQTDLMEVAARALNLSSVDVAVNQPFYLSLLSLMKRIIDLDEEMSEAMAELYKVWLNFNSQPWANSILGFAMREGQPEPHEATQKIAHFAASSTPFIHPLRVSSFVDTTYRLRYVELLKEFYANSPSIGYALTFADAQAALISTDLYIWEQQESLRAESAIEREEFAVALSALGKLTASSFDYYQRKATTLTARCLMDSGKLKECVQLISKAFVRRRQMHYVLPVEQLVERLDSDDRLSLASDMSLAIVYDAYSKHVNSRFDEFRAYAYEDFLSSKGLQRPSTITTIIDSLDKPSLIYFLRYLCVENIMDVSTVFESSNEVTEERLSVLRLLVDLDPSNLDDYHTEIKDIQSRLMIKKRLREVEQSKIYVDLDGIRHSVDKAMKESFTRYISYLKHGLDADTMAFRDVASKKAAEGDIDGLLLLMLPRNEMNDLFKSMVVELRDEFVSSAEHGLNWYLSVRIRHGTFSGHLRSPLEAANLVTQRDRTTGEYKRNALWLDKLEIEDDEVLLYLEKRLSEFSRAFDDLIQEILSDWFQIQKELGDKGMFNFVLTQSQVDLMSSQITEGTTYERFVDSVFSILTSRLDWNLERIRRQIGQEAELRVDAMLNSLLLDIGRIGTSADIRDLSNAITASRTEMQVAFDRVIEWFRLSKATAFEPFLMEDAINISLQSVRTFSPNFNVDLLIVNEAYQIPFDGKQLSTVVDIFFIVFENIVRHSEVNGAPGASLNLTYLEDSIHFRVENDLGANVASDSAKGKIVALKAAMRERKPITPISSEGGTGLLKIWRIIAYDFREEPRLDFGFLNDGKFYVDFTLYTKNEVL